MSTITIPAPVAEEDGEFDYVSHAIEHLFDGDGEPTGPLAQALDYGLDDDRAVIDSIDVEDVFVEDDGSITIDVQVAWSAHYTCDDLNRADVSSRPIHGQVVGETWVFEIFNAPPARSTHEEF